MFLATREWKTISVLTLTAALGLSAQAQARDLSISLTGDSARVQVNTTDPHDELAFGAGYTYRSGGMNIVNLSFHAQGWTALGSLPATVGLGAKPVYFRSSGFDGGGVGLGGYGSLDIPDVPGLSFNIEGHYAPSILSFGDAEDLWSVSTSLNYRVIPNAEFFGGYRYVGVDVDGRSGRARLDEGLMAGLRLIF